MQDGLYVALSAQIALEKRLTTIADNVANMSTVGFRATEVKFEDVVTGVGQNSIAFTSPGDTYLSQKAGGLRETQSPFDFAIQGDAWFGIDTPAGTVMTRDGRFTMTDTGQFVTHEGYAVLDAGGAPIQLDPLNGAPAVGRDGIIRQNGQLVGLDRPVQFQSGAELQPLRQFGRHPAGPAGSCRRPRRRRRRPGFPGRSQRQPGARNDPADHGAALVRKLGRDHARDRVDAG